MEEKKQMLEDFLTDLKLNKSKDCYLNYKKMLNGNSLSFFAFLGKKTVKEINTILVNNFFLQWQSQRLKALKEKAGNKLGKLSGKKLEKELKQLEEKSLLPSTTKNLFRCALKSFLNFHGFETQAEKLELEAIPDASLPKAVSKKHIEGIAEIKLRASELLNKRNKLIVLALFGSAFRVRELATLKKEHLKEGNGEEKKYFYALIEGKHAKTGKEGKVMLSEKWFTELKEYFAQRSDSSPFVFVSKKGNPLTDNSIRAFVFLMARAYCVENKLVLPLGSHALGRHSFAIDLLNRGTHIRIIQRLLRHSSLDSTSKYLVMGDEQVFGRIASPLDT